jgi:hypothetical protein
MEREMDGTKVASHGMFYMESAGGCGPEASDPPADERASGCFALEDEKGEHWSGIGASKPLINEARPRL